MSAAHRSRINICKEATRRLKHTLKSFTEEARSYVTMELWAVSYINPVNPPELNALVLFGKRRNLVSAHLPSHFKCSIVQMTQYLVSQQSNEFQDCNKVAFPPFNKRFEVK